MAFLGIFSEQMGVTVPQLFPNLKNIATYKKFALWTIAIYTPLSCAEIEMINFFPNFGTFLFINQLL